MEVILAFLLDVGLDSTDAVAEGMRLIRCGDEKREWKGARNLYEAAQRYADRIVGEETVGDRSEQARVHLDRILTEMDVLAQDIRVGRAPRRLLHWVSTILQSARSNNHPRAFQLLVKHMDIPDHEPGKRCLSVSFENPVRCYPLAAGLQYSGGLEEWDPITVDAVLAAPADSWDHLRLEVLRTRIQSERVKAHLQARLRREKDEGVRTRIKQILDNR